MNPVTVRYVDTNHGDTLQSIALRELVDSSRWTEIIWLNNLLPPYITDDPLLAGPRVILTGAKIALYAAAAGVSPDEVETFGIDVALDANGSLFPSASDWSAERGYPNLKFALARRLVTEKRTRGFTPEYGCWVGILRGEKLGPAQLALAAFYVKSSLLEDDRVQSVLSCIATGSGDVINVTASITAIDGKELSFEVSI
jgi:hypothetical protein